MMAQKMWGKCWGVLAVGLVFVGMYLLYYQIGISTGVIQYTKPGNQETEKYESTQSAVKNQPIKYDQQSENSVVEEVQTKVKADDKPMILNNRVNELATEYNENIRQRLDQLVGRKATSSDPEVIRLIRDLMDPPSRHIIKLVRPVVETPQSKEVNGILKQKKGGFFVECGALDGERSSNTLHFEQKQGWHGVLIEMDPYFYTQLRGKSRKAYSINACLSPSNYTTKLVFEESSGGSGQLLDPGKRSKKPTKTVPCFPLESILLALNRSHVDYFSLDVEGFELDILKTVPFGRLDISTLSVEYVHGRAGKETYRTFMTQQGYKVHKDIHFHKWDQAMFVDDFILVKNDLQV